MDSKALTFFGVLFFIATAAQAATETAGTVRQYLSSCHMTSIQPLLGGKSNDGLFKVTGEKGIWVLRVLNKRRPLNKRHRVCRVTKMMGDLRIGPKFIWHDASCRFLITEFLEGNTLLPQDMRDPSMIEQLALLLREAHGVLTPMPLREEKPYTLKEKVLDRIEELLQDFPSHAPLLSLRAAVEKLDLKQARRVIHGDIKGENIINVGGRLYLIDWGEVGLSSVWDDLGSCAFFLDLNPQQALKFLESYFQTTSFEKKLTIIKYYQSLASVHHILWSLRTKRDSIPNFFSFLNQRIQHCLMILRSISFIR